MTTAGIVLCGGRSTRMGRAKAWLPWRGQPMLAHVVGVLREVVDEVVVVSSAELALPALDARVVRDREPVLGPLAGIREGLAAIHADRAFVCSTDAPHLSGGFVDALLAVGGAAAAEIDGHVQTLAAVYPRAALACAERLIAAGRLRPLFLLEAVGYRRLAAEALPDVDSVRGFNTPAQYLAAVRAAEPGARARMLLHGRARRAVGRSEIERPVGLLGELLAQLPGALSLIEGERVSPAFDVRSNECERLEAAGVPIGAGECVRVSDAAPAAVLAGVAR